jgi:hypothetical protein
MKEEEFTLIDDDIRKYELNTIRTAQMIGDNSSSTLSQNLPPTGQNVEDRPECQP